MRILAVDDDKILLFTLSKKLKSKGHEVFITTNSIEALRIVSDENIDLVISDIMMPCISGFTLVTMLKNFYFCKIPFIFISAYTDDKLIAKCYETGAGGYIPKPIHYEELIAKIDALTLKPNKNSM